MIAMTHVLWVCFFLFCLGLMGMISGRKNVISLLMSLELMLLAVNISLIGFSSFHQDLSGHIFVFFILTVAAAEAAVGLALIVGYERLRQTIDVEHISSMRG